MKLRAELGLVTEQLVNHALGSTVKLKAELGHVTEQLAQHASIAQ